MPEHIKENLEKVKERIVKAASRVGRDPDSIKIMAVTKTQSIVKVNEAYNLGLNIFGESRVQEAKEKFLGFDKNIDLHLIGHLQSNKAKDAVGLFKCIQSIDRLEIALVLNKICSSRNVKLDILLEINTSREESKFGFRDDKILFNAVEEILKFNTLNIRGLMTIAPYTQNKEIVRKSFKKLNSYYKSILHHYNISDFNILSMGMSNDFEIAVEEGSTMLRLGTILFGDR